ncbi:MAG: pyridoxamine 5'-phosphate oxidase family protein [Proteobacteria bacterium]|nr:pyridoxamine 5'-phosphate oxidase family protein [Pseudomonadota bacterium]
MAVVSEELKATINKPGRVGTLSTVDAEGRPNVAYFGSLRLQEDGTFTVGLARNRTLKNLEANPHAVFFCVEEAPVTFGTKGTRLYLKAREIQFEGQLLDQVREMIAQHAGPAAAKMMAAAVAFDITEVRPIMDMG